jgi:hypothetical protein
MKTTFGFFIILLWLASTAAYGEEVWSSRDHATNEFLTRMNNYRPERFWYDSSLTQVQIRKSSFRGSSRLRALQPQWRFEYRDWLVGNVSISDVRGANIVEFNFVWDFPF